MLRKNNSEHGSTVDIKIDSECLHNKFEQTLDAQGPIRQKRSRDKAEGIQLLLFLEEIQGNELEFFLHFLVMFFSLRVLVCI